MTCDPHVHHRRSVRLEGYNYSWAGAYSVTICAHGRKQLFGRIVDSGIRLSPYGRIIERQWKALPSHYPSVALDSFVIMQNHLHGIIVLTLSDFSQAGRTECIPTPHSLGEIVRGFKALCSREINELPGSTGNPVWQRDYYEHVIRSKTSLNAIRRYIEENVENWGFDPDNPDKAR